MQIVDESSTRGSLSFQEKKTNLQLEKLPIFGYEAVWKVTEEVSGLKAIIAIHNTQLGPALGGTRILEYSSFEEALTDVLRLSKGMTYKSAIAEVGYGGGKSVILLPSAKKNKEELLLAFSQAVEQLQGKYICAEDMGCSVEDIAIIQRNTKYVVGAPHEKSSGDPSPFTAWGTFRGIQSVMQKLYGTDSLQGKKIAVQGLGNVGCHLLDFLFWAGASLILSDIQEEKAKRLARKYGAEVVSVEEILQVECDVLSPCARGGVINEMTLPHFHCKAIAGCANNQLQKEQQAEHLQMRGILYAPDFVINAGGLLNVAAELEEDGYDPKVPREKVHNIYDNLLGIYEIAEKNQISTQAAANALAEYRIRYGIGKRVNSPIFHHST